ncbi:hypothetical protein GRI39_01855 [Altererythrobacter indicus]|uniref:DNA (cytosine-5-)-methyltransferase n=1 Tax=Altericroceibacterium indicum TaxID=374177 RepID=A0A845A3N3_9SPHN|nr:DNA cytosine methyltransferase [Altericroceibacterium indicum]MXP24790.1 hypothetical protein [Altericroceibacterium indicum]
MAIRTRNILSCCAGVGGLELGIILALRHRGEDGRGVCYLEGEAAAAASLVASMEAGWFHPAPVWSDMRSFNARPWRGLVHILASGDPCQDNSVAGKRAGAGGERFLASEVTRLAEECRPDLIFRENVPGNAHEQLAAITPPLEGMGYRVAAGIFSSAGTGNTMRRERLFIMAQRADLGHEWAGATRGRRAGPQDSGCGMDGSAGAERWSINDTCGKDRKHPLSQGQEGPNGSGRATAEMGWTLRDEPQGQQRGQHYPAGREVKGGSSALSGRTTIQPAVIPGPTDSRWIDVLDRFPELQPALSEEEAQSHLRRGIDAVAHRIERLRATGNGVDPVAAATAFLSLSALLDADARETA